MVLYDTFHSICSLSSEGWSEAQIDYISQLQIKLPIRIIQIYIIADEKGQHAMKAPCLCSRLFDLFETELNWWFVSFVGLAWKYNIIVESEWNRWKQHENENWEISQQKRGLDNEVDIKWPEYSKDCCFYQSIWCKMQKLANPISCQWLFWQISSQVNAIFMWFWGLVINLINRIGLQVIEISKGIVSNIKIIYRLHYWFYLWYSCKWYSNWLCQTYYIHSTKY